MGEVYLYGAAPGDTYADLRTISRSPCTVRLASACLTICPVCRLVIDTKAASRQFGLCAVCYRSGNG